MVTLLILWVVLCLKEVFGGDLRVTMAFRRGSNVDSLGISLELYLKETLFHSYVRMTLMTCVLEMKRMEVSHSLHIFCKALSKHLKIVI